VNRIRSHVFRGRRYAVRIEPIDSGVKKACPKAIATCEGPPSSKNKAITIDPKVTGITLLKVAIDEGLHACLGDLDNTAVDEMSESISRFLWRLGFRETMMVGGKPSLFPQDALDSGVRMG
jgi:hypothetical protein